MRPDAFAAVMATGIVSIAAADHDLDVISAVLAAVAAIALPVLVVAAAMAWHRDSWILRDLDVSVGLLTYVAACCVLAARFAEHPAVLWVLGGMALQGWLSLGPMVVMAMRKLGWTGLCDRARGAWELASVATSGLAIVFVEARIVLLALIVWVVALGVYCAMTALILWRARHDASTRRDVPPDHWIVMGGLAIATLAGDHIHHALLPGPIADAVRVVTVVTWADPQLARHLPARHVLVGDLRDGVGDGVVRAAGGVAGVLLARVGRLAPHPPAICGDSAAVSAGQTPQVARRTSAITRSGYSVRSSQVNRSTCQPRRISRFCRTRSFWKSSTSL
jgi:Voltage-dependent anion channel